MKALEFVLKMNRQFTPFTFDDDMVYDALICMKKYEVGALLVRNAAGQLIGILSERDYARKVLLRGKRSTSTQVKEIMSTPLIFGTPESSLSDCMRIMVENEIRHLPIVEKNICYGYVSVLAVASYLLGEREELIDQLNKYICGSQFAPPIIENSLIGLVS